jgi:Zn-dependent metalloprotease
MIHGHGVCEFLPPYILGRLAASTDARVRKAAVDAIVASAEARAVRTTLARLPIMAAVPSATRAKERRTYDVRHGGPASLPGRLVRREGAPAGDDDAVNEAHDGAGVTYDFYAKVFDRNSLDDDGMALISSVHYLRDYNNAMWNGEQMVYGDGDGELFLRFTRSLEVIGHELTHGVVAHTSNLRYRDESGALNEHFADVFGLLVKQWSKRQTAKRADWTVGAALMGPRVKAKCIRTFKKEKAFADDPYLGDDPQPKHMRDKYEGRDDYGGVHINSGIPNHAFYRVAIALGGRAWERAGTIWFRTMTRLSKTAEFADMASTTRAVAAELHGKGSAESQAVAAAWKAVGL